MKIAQYFRFAEKSGDNHPLHFRKNCTSSVFFLNLGSFQVLPWNLRQLISYFSALIIYSINLLKTARKTFATGNAIYPLSRTIIQITNDNSIFHKERIESGVNCTDTAFFCP